VNYRDKLKPKYVYKLSQQQIASALGTNDSDILNAHMSEDLGEAGIISLTSVLHHFSNLEELRLWSFTSIGKKGGEALGQSLQHLPKLRYIEVHGAMGPEGTQAFAQGLAYTPKLVSLDLEESGVGDLGCQAIAHQFPNLPELKHINLSYVPHGTPGGNEAFITDTGASHLREGLGQHSNIDSLILKGHHIKSENIEALAILLIHCKNENSLWDLSSS
jgi:Ran GTPase-activating protein (RanGAP) involved in mRNA processing and transport